MRKCSDKIKVRDYVREKIGEGCLKPVLQICDLYEEIDFDKLPTSFIIKCSHGCKWQYTVKDKEDYLATKPFVNITRRNINGWLEHEFWVFGGFEMQYAASRRVLCREKGNQMLRFLRGKPIGTFGARTRLCEGIEPKILIEPLLRPEINTFPREIEVYCFNGQPEILENVRYTKGKRDITYYDKNFEAVDIMLNPDDGKNRLMNEEADDILKQTYDLSKNLAKDFSFVRVDWLVCNNNPYFNELTFTPFSGFIELDKNLNEKLGNFIELN